MHAESFVEPENHADAVAHSGLRRFDSEAIADVSKLRIAVLPAALLSRPQRSENASTTRITLLSVNAGFFLGGVSSTKALLFRVQGPECCAEPTRETPVCCALCGLYFIGLLLI